MTDRTHEQTVSATRSSADTPTRAMPIIDTAHRDASRADVADLLTRTRAAVGPALQDAVAQLPTEVGKIASYHFGWGSAPPAGGFHADTWGKGLRSALVLTCAEAVGGQAVDALPAAVAVELMHNATLIHDDLIDTDPLRRQRRAVWSAFGLPTAVLVGDALLVAAIQALHGGGVRCIADATAVITAAGQKLIDGERADVSFETQRSVSVTDCLAMIEAKTGSLIECACTLGARYGGASRDRVLALGRFGHHLGVAFQIIDDCLGIWGNTAEIGKPVLADLVHRKKSLPVVIALNSPSPAANRLAGLYRGPGHLSEADAQLAAELIVQTGARTRVAEMACHHKELAISELDRAHLIDESADALRAITEFATDRHL